MVVTSDDPVNLPDSVLPLAAFPSSSGSRAMLMATRRASSAVSMAAAYLFFLGGRLSRKCWGTPGDRTFASMDTASR